MSARARLDLRLALVFALFAAPACDPTTPTEAEPDLADFDTSLRGIIDCTTREDTGYSSGSAFALTVVTVDGRPAELDTANAYYVMQQAAAADGVSIAIVSGFRTMAEQEYLYGCYVHCNCNSCNLAARPGYSNHQSGHALDLNTSAPGVLDWLNAHGAAFGFSRTVPSEPWHWEWWGGGPGGGPCGRCEPHCEGSEMVGADCGRGDCGVFGARCVNDALGLRCASIFCPDTGEADVCVNETVIGHCADGALSTGDCSAYAAYCSTVAGPARCVSAFCVGSGTEVPVAHDTCLPDGGRYRCTALGGLEASPCADGETCTMGQGGATCASPSGSTHPGDPSVPTDPASSDPSAPRTDPPDPSAPTSLRPPVVGTGVVLPSPTFTPAAGFAGGAIEGRGCSAAGPVAGDAGFGPGLVLFAFVLASRRRARDRR